MEKESFPFFEDGPDDPDYDRNDSGAKRRKLGPHRNEWKEDFKKNAERERKRRKERQKARREKDRTDWDAEE
ncbi:MAG: hypothetical protein WAL98_12625 [Desulfatiglandaceae bacterium]